MSALLLPIAALTLATPAATSKFAPLKVRHHSRATAAKAQPDPAESAAFAPAMEGLGPEQIVFKVDKGVVMVYLPRTMAPGDTVSGSVFVQPAGKDWDEEQHNYMDLLHCHLRVGDLDLPVQAMMFTIHIPKDANVLPIDVDDPSGHALTQTSVPLPITGDDHKEPGVRHVVEAQMPITIHGDFDGDRVHTFAEIDGRPVGILAEGAGQCYVTAPAMPGPFHLRVKEHHQVVNDKVCVVRVAFRDVAKTLSRRCPTLEFTLEGLKDCPPSDFPIMVDLTSDNPKAVGFAGPDAAHVRVAVTPEDMVDGHILKVVPMRRLGKGSYQIFAHAF